MQWLSFGTAKSNAEIRLHCMLMTTLSSIASARWLQERGLKERAGEVLPVVVLTGLDTWDLFLAPLPLPRLSYSYLYALNVLKKSPCLNSREVASTIDHRQKNQSVDQRMKNHSLTVSPKNDQHIISRTRDLIK